MKAYKRFLCLLLAASLVLSFGAFGVCAQEADAVRLLGDIDGNGVVDVSDATLMQIQLAEGTYDLSVADVDQNGAADVSDVTYIQMFAADILGDDSDCLIGRAISLTSEPVTQPVTEAVTTEPVTVVPTEPVSEIPTEAPTEPVTEIPTEVPTEAVTEPPTEPVLLSLDCDTLKLGVGESYPLAVSTNASEPPRFFSDNPDAAAVDENGSVTAQGVGVAVITCEAGGAAATCAVEVCPPASSLTLNKTALTLAAGEVYDLNSTVNSGAAAYYRAYFSDNEAVASVTEEGGYVTANSAGTAVVTCLLQNGVKAECTVTVKPFAPSLSLNKNVLTLETGDTFDFDSTVPSGTAAYFRDYYSENPEVASIAKSGGLLTAESVGTTRIYCELGNGIRAYATVTVEEKSLVRAQMVQYLREQVGNNNRSYISYINAHSNFATTQYTAWCAIFAWCCMDAFAVQNNTKNPVSPQKYVSDIANQAKKYNALRNCADTDYVPKPGDLFLTATSKHPVNGLRCHIGYVEYVDTDKNGNVTAIHTIEGNYNWETTASNVTKVTRSVWKPNQVRYGAFISEFIDITALFPESVVR